MATVFLDLDGTLTDAGEGILNSVDYALRKLSLPGLSGDNRWIVGPPLWPSFAKLGVQTRIWTVRLGFIANAISKRAGKKINFTMVF